LGSRDHQQHNSWDVRKIKKVKAGLSVTKTPWREATRQGGQKEGWGERKRGGGTGSIGVDKVGLGGGLKGRVGRHK